MQSMASSYQIHHLIWQIVNEPPIYNIMHTESCKYTGRSLCTHQLLRIDQIFTSFKILDGFLKLIKNSLIKRIYKILVVSYDISILLKILSL